MSDITLLETELLELKNITLRRQVQELTHQNAMAALREEEAQLAGRIEKRTGVDVRTYNVHAKTGVATPPVQPTSAPVT